MEIDKLLKEELIIDDLSATTKEEVLEQMADYLYKRGYVKDSFKDAILKREKFYPSGLPMPGEKIAIPHTDAEHVNSSTLLFARLKSPVTFSVMGAPEQTMEVRLISMFALKEKREIGALLETLLTTYQDEALLSRLAEAPSGLEIYSLLHGAVGAQLEARA